ncbi:MAG: MFS transporter [Rhizomicrobium sp.]
MADDPQEDAVATVKPGWGITIGYAGYALPAGLMIPPFSLLLPAFYSQVMGVSLAVVGGVVGAFRIYDLILNPILGVLSDRTQTRFGRRKPWMIAGMPLLAVGLWLVFAPPVTHGSALYLGIALFVFYTGSSLVMIPYYALGAEVPATPYGRARMLGLREAVMMAALVFAGLCPLAAKAFGFAAASRETMLIILGTLVVLTPPALAALLFVVPDKVPPQEVVPRFSLLEIMRDFWDALIRNRAFGRLAVAYAVINFAIFTDQALNLFFLSKILRIEQVFGVALLVQGVMTVAAAPLWVWLSKRIELHKVIAISIVLASLFRAGAYSWLPPGAAGAYLIIQAIGAVLFSGTLVLASAIQATAIDYGSLVSGRERAGTYISANNIVTQFAAALPFIVVFPLLEFAGFSATGTNTPFSLQLLRVLTIYGALPFQLISAWLIWNFPISRKQAAENSGQLLLQRNAEIEIGALPAP